MTLAPVFIVGFPRSGTTAMAKAICSDPEFFGDRHEGHFLYLFQPALDLIAGGEVNPAALVRPPANRELFACVFAQAIDGYVRGIYGRPGGRWIDKTPDLPQIKALPMIHRLYPAARYVMMTRNVIDVVRSNVAAWPKTRDNLRGLAKRWAACHADWRAFKPTIAADAWIEIDQRALRENTANFIAPLQRLLEISTERASRMVDFLARNQEVNRPSGRGAEAYDQVNLSAAECNEVLLAAGGEARLWP